MCERECQNYKPLMDWIGRSRWQSAEIIRLRCKIDELERDALRASKAYDVLAQIKVAMRHV